MNSGTAMIIGFVAGVLITAFTIGGDWKHSVVSGDYFTVGKVWYSCTPQIPEFKPGK